MNPYRKEMVCKEIKRVTADLVQKELRDPRLGFVSVTKAEVSSDFKYAKIFFSVMGNERQQKKTMAGLRHAKGFIQKELSRAIRMKSFPEIRFELDDSIEKAFKMTQLLDKLAAERNAQEAIDAETSVVEKDSSSTDEKE
jgi:ribosome-binding factor A